MRKQPGYMGVTCGSTEFFCVVTYRRSRPSAKLNSGSQSPADWLGLPFIKATGPFQTPHEVPVFTKERVVSKRIIVISDVEIQAAVVHPASRAGLLSSGRQHGIAHQ